MKRYVLSVIGMLLLFSSATAQLRMVNTTGFDLSIAVAYYQQSAYGRPAGWVTQGWYQIKAGSGIQVFSAQELPDRITKTASVYYTVYKIDDKWWQAEGTANFLVNPSDAFTVQKADLPLTQKQQPTLSWRQFNLLKITPNQLAGGVTEMIREIEGCTQGDCREGQGSYRWVLEGKEYTGQWRGGQRSGRGKMIYRDYHRLGRAGESYEGEWRSNDFHGQGTYTWKDRQYVGSWFSGKRHGPGKITYFDNHPDRAGYSFDGIWINDDWKEGELTYPDGKVYKGAFQNRKRNGEGELFDPAGKLLEKGIWQNDQLVKPEIAVPVVNWDKPFRQEINVGDRAYTIKACIQSPDGLRSVEVFHNDLLVADRGFTVEENCTQAVEMEIKLRKGKNDFYIVAVNEAGETVSEHRTINYSPAQETTEEAQPSAPLTNFHALLIGISEYEDLAINDLPHPIKDAQKLAKLLESDYNFKEEHVHFLENPDKEILITKISQLQQQLTEEDYLLIFFAGHGKLLNDEGYWLAANARLNNPYNWISSSEFNAYLKGFKSKHILLITDACYSGAFVMRDAGGRYMEQACEVLEAQKSRTAMTSGAKTTVPDESVFIKYLIKFLKQNKLSCISAEQVFFEIKNQVIINSPNNQIPQYGDIPRTGHEGGNFLFKRN